METGRTHKRHHQVPRFYLERFSDNGSVLVRRRDGAAFRASTNKVAVEAGFYDVPVEGGTVVRTVEPMLAKIEGLAKMAIDAIDKSGVAPHPDAEDRATLATFLAIQMTRTTEYRERTMFAERIAAWAGDRELTQDLVAAYLETEHLGFTPRDREAEGAYIYAQKSLEDGAAGSGFAVGVMLRGVEGLASKLSALNWTIETARTRGFITSDTPVVIWRKPSRRDHYQGIGVDRATEVRFPLDTGKQLVMSRRVRRRAVEAIAVHRVNGCNSDMAAGSHRFLVAHPDARLALDRPRLSRWRPVLRFNIAPGYDEGPDGQLTKMRGEILHMWVPRGAGVGRTPRDTPSN